MKNSLSFFKDDAGANAVAVVDEFENNQFTITRIIDDQNLLGQTCSRATDQDEIKYQNLKSKILQARIAEIQQQKILEEQNLVSAKENTKHLIDGMNPEQRDYVVQKLREQGKFEIADIILNHYKKRKILTLWEILKSMINKNINIA